MNYDIDFSNRTSGGYYNHGYIRTIPTALAVVATCFGYGALAGAGVGASAGVSAY